MRTRSEMAEAVLRQLGKLDALDSAPAESSSYIQDRYSEKYEEWRDRELIYWTNTDAVTEEIPLVVFPVVVDLMANVVQSQFGMMQTSEERDAREERILRRLRRHITKPSSGLETQFSDY